MDWEKIKAGLWGAVGGAVVLAIFGFNYGGWVTGGTAQTMAKDAAALAVAERLGAICVAQLDGDAAKSQKIKEMQGKDPWDKGKFIETQRWAIMPGAEKPESGVADECAKQLTAKA
jgi:hypothetical protein